MFAGGYLLEAELGHGASGTVYRARHPQDGSVVAVKVLDASLVADPAVRARLHREAEVMARVASPNCVALYGHGEDDAGAWIAMEYVHGADLRTVLRYAGRMTAAQACGLLTGALGGLGRAHSLGVIHRDFKPENILVDGSGVSKLTDFGLVASRDDPARWRPLEGSPTYMSPEQVRGEALDPRSDLYSAGAVLYELLAGRPPYEAESPVALLHAHVSGPLPSVSGLPDQVGQLVLRALAKDPGERPATAEQFAAELNEAARKDLGVAWLAAAGIAGLVGGALAGGAIAADLAATGTAPTGTGATGTAATETTSPAMAAGAAAPMAAVGGQAVPRVPAGRWHRARRATHLVSGHPVLAAGAAVAIAAATTIGVFSGAFSSGHRTSPKSPTRIAGIKVGSPATTVTMVTTVPPTFTDLRTVDWSSVTVPRGTCGAANSFALDRSQATITTSRFPGFPQVQVYDIVTDGDPGAPPGFFGGLAFGDLEADGHVDGVLRVTCDTGGHTGSSTLADDLVVYSGAGGVHSIGLLHTSAPSTYNAPYFAQVVVSPGTVMAVEDYYKAGDPSAAPSGKQTDTWSLNDIRSTIAPGASPATTAPGASPATTAPGASPATTAPTAPSSNSTVSPLRFATPGDIAAFLVAHGIPCDGYHDYGPDAIETGAKAQGACTSSGNDVELLTFADAGHRDAWAKGLRSLSASGCSSGDTGANATTTLVLGATWASYVNGLENAPSQPLTAQIAAAAGTRPANICS